MRAMAGPGGDPLRGHGARAARSAAPTTCTARCGNLDLDAVLRADDGSRPRTRQTRRVRSPIWRSAWPATSSRPASTQLRKEIEAEIRRRLVADRGREALAKSVRKPLPEDIDFMHATRDELAVAAPGASTR